MTSTTTNNLVTSSSLSNLELSLSSNNLETSSETNNFELSSETNNLGTSSESESSLTFCLNIKPPSISEQKKIEKESKRLFKKELKIKKKQEILNSKRIKKREKRITKSKIKWELILKQEEEEEEESKSRSSRTRGKSFKTFIFFYEIHPSLRGKIWQKFIFNNLSITPELFNIYKNKCHNEIETIKMIDLDLPRTFPAISFFKNGGPEHDKLRILLTSYVLFRPDVGYVQGMSFIGAMLLLNLDIYPSFLCLCNILNNPILKDFYWMNIEDINKRLKNFRKLMKNKIPIIAKKFEEFEIRDDLYLYGWIMTLFSNSLPLDTSIRIFDWFIVLNSDDILFKIAIAILIILKNEILILNNFEDIACLLSKSHTSITSEKLAKVVYKLIK